MLCLTRPRTCTCTHTYYLYPLTPHLASNGFMSIGTGIGNRNSDRDDRSCPEEEEVRPWCARWSCSATAMQDRATLNALVEDSLKKSTEGHHDAFARIEPNCWVIL
jgi:hypothetical protein